MMLLASTMSIQSMSRFRTAPLLVILVALILASIDCSPAAKDRDRRLQQRLRFDTVRTIQLDTIGHSGISQMPFVGAEDGLHVLGYDYDNHTLLIYAAESVARPFEVRLSAVFLRAGGEVPEYLGYQMF